MNSMIVVIRSAALAVVLLAVAAGSPASLLQEAPPHEGPQHEGFSLKRSDGLDQLVASAVVAAVEKFGKGGLTREKIAMTVIDLNDRSSPAWASHRGKERIYPASVVKLFYLAAAHHQME